MLALMACRRQRRLATRAYVCQQIREFRSTTKRVQKGIAVRRRADTAGTRFCVSGPFPALSGLAGVIARMGSCASRART